MGLFAWLRRGKPAAAPSRATRPPEPETPPTADGPALSPSQRELRSSVLEEYDFDYLAMFDLVQPVEGYCLVALPEGQEQDLAGARDRLMEQALIDAIDKLEEPEVPREIAGQRLAAVIDVCKSAQGWTDMPATAAVAQRYLDRA